MKRDVTFGMLLLVVMTALALTGLATTYRQPDRRPGDAFPALALDSLNGAPATFDGRGKPAIVTVFATWCVPCREEFGKIAAVSASRRASRVRFVEVDEADPPSRVADFLRNYPNLHATVFLDRTNAVHALGIYSFPRTVAVAANGKVRARFDGPMGYDDLYALVGSVLR